MRITHTTQLSREEERERDRQRDRQRELTKQHHPLISPSFPPPTHSNNHWEMPHLCCAQLGGMGAIRNCQAKAAANLEKPILAPLWAAGMSFSRCHAERDVPNDINLRHIFTGEEFGRGVRLWTHGYDFYSITRPIIGVYYGGAKGGKGGWVNDATEMKASYQRLGTLLEWPNSDQSEAAKRKMKGYEIGKRRSLKMCVVVVLRLGEEASPSLPSCSQLTPPPPPPPPPPHTHTHTHPTLLFTTRPAGTST